MHMNESALAAAIAQLFQMGGPKLGKRFLCGQIRCTEIGRRRRVLRPHSLAAVEECRAAVPDESVPGIIAPRIRSATVQDSVLQKLWDFRWSYHGSLRGGWSEVRSNGPREVERRRRQIAKGMLKC